MNRNKTKLQDKSQKWFIYLILAAFSLETIIRYIVIVLSKLPLISFFADWFTPLLFIILIFFNYNRNIKEKIWHYDILFVIVFYLIVAISYLIHPDTRPYVEDQINTFLFIFPAYYLLGIIFDINKNTMDALAFLAKIIIVVDILFVMYYAGAGNELGEDAMARAYRMLPSVLFLIMQAFNRKKVFDWVWMVFASLYIFTCGTRGPIVVVVVYLAYCLLLKKKSNLKGKLISAVALGAAILFYFSKYFNVVIESLATLFSKFGVSTRVLEHILEDSLVSDSSGRDVIYKRIYGLLGENPFGYGIMGEYPFLAWNTHNFYLQLLMHFGIFLGTLIIVYVLWNVIASYRVAKPGYERDFIVVWACITLVRGFAGGSYLSYYFALLLGLCIGIRRSATRIENNHIKK